MTTTEAAVEQGTEATEATTGEQVAEQTQDDNSTETRVDPTVEKAPTDLQRFYAMWLHQNTGYLPEGAEVPAQYSDEGNAEWEKYVKVIQLAVTKYNLFQGSPENIKRRLEEQERKAQEKAEAASKREAERAERLAKKTQEASERAAALAAKKAEAEKPPAKKAAPAKGAKKAAGNGAEAPF